MNDQELQQWIERVSLTYFGRPFLHAASFNSRLRTTGGRYFTKSHNIEISPHQLAVYGAEETEAIIKHELCHYHLHLQRKGYQHRDADFKRLLVEVGATRHCRALPGAARSLPVRVHPLMPLLRDELSPEAARGSPQVRLRALRREA